MRFAAIALWLIGGAAHAGEAYTPSRDDIVLERIPRTVFAERRVLRASAIVAASAPSLAGAIASARAAIALGRSQADPRYFGYAQAALAPWWTLTAPPPEVQLLRATLLQQRHDFTAALVDLDALIARDPGNVQARLIRAVVHQVRGQPLLARPDCAAVATADLYASGVCLASVQALTGHAHTALSLLDVFASRGGSADERGWALTLAAEIAARIGDASAGARFASAMQSMQASGHDDPYLMDAYSDYLLATGRAQQAQSLLRGSESIDAHLLRLTIADRALGSGDFAAHASMLQDRFAAAAQRGDGIHLREQAMYFLHVRDDAETALKSAVANWSSQREPADAIVLLEAARRAREPAAAKPVLEWMQDTGIEDARLRKLRADLERGG